MTSLLLLWIALFQAVASTTNVSASWRGDSGFAHVRNEQSFAQWSIASSSVPEETVRVPARAASVVAERASGTGPFARATALPFDCPLRGIVLPATGQRPLASDLDVHRLASGGTVLPYFPTAPPHTA